QKLSPLVTALAVRSPARRFCALAPLGPPRMSALPPLQGLSGHPSAIAERPAIYEHTPELDNLVFAELVDLGCVKTKPVAQNFICVVSKQRRRLDFPR